MDCPDGVHVPRGGLFSPGQQGRPALEDDDVRFDELIEEAGCEKHGDDLLLPDPAPDLATVQERITRGKRDAAAIQERSPDLEGRGVEGERASLQDAVALSQLD